MPPLQPQAAHFGLILPLCSSSATIGLALYQYPQFFSFLSAENDVAGKALSHYWTPMVKQGYIVIGGLGLTTTVSGILASRWLKTHQTLETSDVSNWYTYGAVLAAAHFAFFPLISGPIKRMVEAGTGSGASAKTDEQIAETNRTELKTWLTFHTARTVVDLAALWCFAEGAAQSLWVTSS